MNAEIEGAGIAGKVPARVIRSLASMGKGPNVRGVYQSADKGGITMKAEGSTDGMLGVARHEIIHALRDHQRWGRQYGLFTGPEWKALVRAARGNKEVVAAIKENYPDAKEALVMEEAVAEMYRLWRRDRTADGLVAQAFSKMRAFFDAVANALLGEGFVSAAQVMERIARGDVGGRGPDGPGGGGKRAPDRAMQLPKMPKVPNAKDIMPGSAGERGLFGRMLTDAMMGANSGGLSILSLVPGRPLYTELGKNLQSAGAYMRFKEKMDAMRQDWHAKTDITAQAWRKLVAKNGKANTEMMDLMHEATIAGVDPANPFEPKSYMRGDRDAIAAERAIYDELRGAFRALPSEFQAMYRTVRDRYKEMGDAFEEAIAASVEKAMSKGMRRADQDFQDELNRMDDDGLTGKERDKALAEAERRRDTTKAKRGWNKQARLAALRKEFESNRVPAPYFPLSRFGKYFVALRDAKTKKMVSFSKFESEKEQQAFARKYQNQTLYTVCAVCRRGWPIWNIAKRF